ncbi:MAG: FHA domain-containing protein [Bacteroidales bacterium]|nr:FHA domain-containing protein [Bacteroidales bacterium]
MDKIAGWLIVHTENKEHLTFELKLGKNIIGRSTPKHKPDIPLSDVFSSRRHAALIVKINDINIYEYYIADNADVNDGQASKNGTYINGNIERLANRAQKIIDGDTMQIGLTKLVLKTADITVDVEEAIKLVKRQEYQTTVDFQKQDILKKKL